MKVYAIHEPVRQSFAVYVELGAVEDGRYFETLSAGQRGVIGSERETVKVPHGEEPPLWARIPQEIAEALAEALAPRPVATERHLDDAIALRDRLLTLVEKAHDGWKP